jgi:hypothetical protein
MLVEKGKFYKNKTWEYLLPCFKLYDSLFIEYFNKLIKIGVGVHDALLDDEDYPIGEYLYILIDTAYYPEQFETFLEYLTNRATHLYVTDYSFGPSLDAKQHMVVVKIPEKAKTKYKLFVEGKYSLMYTTMELICLNLKTTRPLAYSVIQKTPEGYAHYQKRIKSVFGVSIPLEEITGELDTPPGTYDEIFNFEKVVSPYYVQNLVKKLVI